MKTDIQFVKLNPIKRIESLAVKKVNSLSSKFNRIIGARIYFRQDRSSDGRGKICEISLSVPGPMLFASSNGKSFEASLAEVISELERQLHKRKP